MRLLSFFKRVQKIVLPSYLWCVWVCFQSRSELTTEKLLTVSPLPKSNQTKIQMPYGPGRKCTSCGRQQGTVGHVANRRAVPQLKGQGQAATIEFQALTTLCGNGGCMMVNRMVDKMMAKDKIMTRQQRIWKFTDNTHTWRLYSKLPRKVGASQLPPVAYSCSFCHLPV